MNTLTLKRKALGLSQEQIAKALGIKRSAWSMYEYGKRTLPTETESSLNHLHDAMTLAPVDLGFLEPAEAEQEELAIRQVNQERIVLTVQLQELETKLRRMKQRNENTRNLMLFLVLAIGEGETVPREKENLQEDLRNAKKSYLATLPIWQEKLEKEIACVKAKIDILNGTV